MSQSAPQWKEVYLGGSEAAERAMIERFSHDILAVQNRVAAAVGKQRDRTFHAKMILGVENALFTVDPTLPQDLAAGYFQPKSQFSASVRFSNASPLHQGDVAADMRGAAVRVRFSDADYHDFLMTSYPVSHARDAWQFIEIAKIATGPKSLLLPRLVLKLGLAETMRVVRNIKTGSKPAESVATLQFWSRAPLLWGKAGPVRYTLKPLAQRTGIQPDAADMQYLSREFAARLSKGDVSYRLAVQRYLDEKRTPIENGAAEWREKDAPFIEIATLTIPMQDLNTEHAAEAGKAVNGLAFNPWNCPEPFRPLGSLNRARKKVYLASAAGWLGEKPSRPKTGASVLRSN